MVIKETESTISNQTDLKELTRLEEYRKAKINGFERRVLLLVREQEVLRLKIPMNHTMLVAELNNLNNRLRDSSGSTFSIVPSSNDAIEELAALAELHNKMNSMLILTSLPKRHDARAPRKMAHDGDLPPHILNVNGSAKLPLGNGLAGKQLPGILVHTKVGDAKLTAAELAVNEVLLLDVTIDVAGSRQEDGEGLRFGLWVGGTVRSGLGFARVDVFTSHSGGGAAAVAHWRGPSER